MFTMLVRALGLPPAQGDPFTWDDTTSHWVGTGGWLEAGVAAGIVRHADYPNGFGPDKEITREEIAVMATRAARPGGGENLSTANTLTDAAAVTPARLGFVAEAARLGLMTGYPDGTFRPANRATRAEAVVIALRVAGARGTSNPGGQTPVQGQPQPQRPWPEVVPGPTRECLENALGLAVKQQIENGALKPTAAQDALIQACLSAQPQQGQGQGMTIVAAPDKLTHWSLGPVTISTYNPVTWIPGFDTRTNLFFTLQNKGATPATVRFESLSDLRGPDKPDWLYSVLGYGDLYQGSIDLAPGETEIFELVLSTMRVDRNVEQTVPFAFKLLETGQVTTLPLTFIVKDSYALLRHVAPTATIAGRVTTPDGAPVAGATVTLYYIHGENHLRAVTDADGRYRIEAPSSADLQRLMGPRPQPHGSDSFTLLVDAAGHEAWSKSGVTVAAKQQLTLNAQLQPAKAPVSYRLTGELTTDGRYGYWWTKFLGQTGQAVSVQGQHPPRLDLPGHILGLDMQGRELWRLPTGNECWALDTAPDGQTLAAGCHDGVVYVVDSAGKLLWKKSVGRSGNGFQPELYGVRFSPDSALLLVDRGPAGDSFGVYSVLSGEPVWAPQAATGQVRGARWSPDGQRLATTHNEGEVRMWTRDGKLLWTSWIGEIPFEFEVDAAYNVYGGGKTQYLTSLDGNTGAVRWRRYMDSTLNEGVRHLTAAGDLLMVDSFNGLLHAIDPKTGTTLWQRQLPAMSDVPNGTGHNAFDMTPDGSLMVVGSRGYQVLVYDKNGALLWKHQASQRSDFPGDPDFHGHYTGALSIAISPDGRFIVAGYADSVLRVFERQP